jgi:AAA family ATP:ADP antiporter
MSTFTPTERFLSLFTTLRASEGRGASLLAIQAFTIMFAYYMLRVVRDPLILSEGTPELKSYTTAMQAILLMFIVPIFTRIYHALGHTGAKHILFSRIVIFFVFNLVLFALAYSSGLRIAIAFYIWLGIFSVMTIALFWGFSADLYNVKSGQRIFVLVAAAASGGAYFGSKFAGSWGPTVGHDGVMYTAAMLLLIPVWLCRKVDGSIPPGSRSQIADEFHKEPPPISEGFMVVFRSYYLTMIALLIVVMNLINTNGEYILSSYVTQEADRLLAAGELVGGRDAFLTRFYSGYNAWFTLVGFGIQLFLVARIFDKIGVRGAILVLPCLMLLNYSLLLLFPMLAVARVTMIAENATSYSLQNTTRQALFLPVRRDEKYVGKNCIDTVFHRVGDVLSALAVLIGSSLLGLGLTGFVATNLVLAIVMFWFSRIIGRRNQIVIEENLGNLPPQVGLPLPDMDIAAGEISQMVLHEDSFLDPDEGDALRFMAYQDFDNNLPRWVRFDPLHRSFEFRPPPGSNGELEIRVVARDFDGLEAEASFRIRFCDGSPDTDLA